MENTIGLNSRAKDLAATDLVKKPELEERVPKEQISETVEEKAEKPTDKVRNLAEKLLSTKDGDKAEEESDEGVNLQKITHTIRKNYPTWFNVATVGLHSLGALLPSMQVVPKEVSQSVRQAAISFSRWGLQIAKIHNGIEALYGNRGVEAAARVIPSLLVPGLKLPFFNFQLAYGLSSGVNVALEHIYDRVGELKKEDGMKKNIDKVFKGLNIMIKDLAKGKANIREWTKLFLTLGGSAFMLGGSIPALAFARNSLNDTKARVFGSLRSIGGLLGDLSIILFSTKKTKEGRQKERAIGLFFMVPSIMDFAQRWIKQGSEANEIFNHFKTALHTIGELIWSHFSTERNIKPKEQKAL